MLIYKDIAFSKAVILIKHIVHLRQECHNSKFGIFELLV